MSLHRRAVLVVLLSTVALAGTAGIGSATASGAVTGPAVPTEPLTTGEQYCHGQRITISLPNDTATNVTYTLTRSDDTEPVATVGFNGTGRAVVNTSGLSNGTYILRDEANETLVTNESGVVIGRTNTSNASFRVRTCSFDAQFEYYSFDMDLGEQIALQVDATLTDTVFLDTPGIPDDVLAAMADGTVTDSGVRVAVPENGRIPLTVTKEFYCGPGTGRYEFTVRSAKTRQVRTVTIWAEREMEARGYVDAPETVSRGNVTRVFVWYDTDAVCWDDSDVVVRIGTNTSEFRVRTGIDDRDSDGNTLILLDTSTAGTVPAAGFMRANGSDSLRNPTLVTEPRTRPIPAGGYRVNLSADGRELDVAAVRIAPNESFTPPSSTFTTTATTGTQTTTATPAPTASGTSESVSAAKAPTTSAEGAGFGTVLTLASVLLFAARRIR